MRSYLIVALGGAVGAISRFGFSGWVASHVPGWSFPLPTLLVNVFGCFIAGALTGGAERWNVLSPEFKLLFFTGILGGFTTFSAFSLESIVLFKKDEFFLALLYIMASVFGGLMAFAGGLLLTRAS
jgi:CrcB protein